MISCGGGVESAVRDRISCAWSKWRELVSLLLNHSISLEEREKVYCECVRTAFFFIYYFHSFSCWPIIWSVTNLSASILAWRIELLRGISFITSAVASLTESRRCGKKPVS